MTTDDTRLTFYGRGDEDNFCDYDSLDDTVECNDLDQLWKVATGNEVLSFLCGNHKDAFMRRYKVTTDDTRPLRCICGEIESNRWHREPNRPGWHPFVPDLHAAPPTTDDTRPRLTCSEFHYPAAVLAERARHAALVAALADYRADHPHWLDPDDDGCPSCEGLRAALIEEARKPKNRQGTANLGDEKART